MRGGRRSEYAEIPTSALKQYRLEHVYKLRGGSQKIKQIAPTARRWASEGCGVMSAICIIPPEVISLTVVSGSDRRRKERTILTYLDKPWFLACCLDRGENSKT